MPLLKTMTAREIREAMPDPTTLNIAPIPGKLRRELYRALQIHDPVNIAELCRAYDANAGNMTRDLYFQFAHMLNFPIQDWLEREGDILDRQRLAARQRDTTPARVAKGKLAIAVAKLESLGYAWHGASNDFVRLPDQW